MSDLNPQFNEPAPIRATDVSESQTQSNDGVRPVEQNGATVVQQDRQTAPSQPTKQDLPAKVAEESYEPQSYVHLADGTVLRCYDADLPAGGGTGTPHGFWQRDNKVYQVIGVYPVESTVEG
jgi:hypothetical protein